MRPTSTPRAYPAPSGHAARPGRTTQRGGATWTCRASRSAALPRDGRSFAFARSTPPATSTSTTRRPQLALGARAHAAERRAGHDMPEAPAAVRRAVPAAHSGGGDSSSTDHGGWGGGGGGGGFAEFTDARAYARLLRLRSEQQWRQRCATGMPASVPSRPDAVYANSG